VVLHPVTWMEYNTPYAIPVHRRARHNSIASWDNQQLALTALIAHTGVHCSSNHHESCNAMLTGKYQLNDCIQLLSAMHVMHLQATTGLPCVTNKQAHETHTIQQNISATPAPTNDCIL
jgi:hypothetical protein